MKTIRLVLAGFIALGASIAVVQACGGQIIVGYDDAGNYHTSDGSVLVIGSVCATWDASHYFEDGGTNCDPSTGTTQCTAWFVPPPMPLVQLCASGVGVTDDAGQPVVDDAGQQVVDYDSGTCDPKFFPIDGGKFDFWSPTCGPAGTQAGADYCSAFYGQYVTHGQVLASCIGSGSNTGCAPFPANSYYCGGAAGPFMLLLQLDDGGTECVAPCAP